MKGAPSTLTLRQLNRALLARQLLLERERSGLVNAVERLACSRMTRRRRG